MRNENIYKNRQWQNSRRLKMNLKLVNILFTFVKKDVYCYFILDKYNNSKKLEGRKLAIKLWFERFMFLGVICRVNDSL